MHLRAEWRDGFFRQLDSLLSSENWDPDDVPPDRESFATLLRMLLSLRPDRRPGLGATANGLMIAAWTIGEDRLTIKCLPSDRVSWVVFCQNEMGTREVKSGKCDLLSLGVELNSFSTERWFNAPNEDRS
jgi:hypothetical protein